jgi:hypothetical protein
MRHLWWLRQSWGFASTVFEDAPRSRVCVRVFIGMSVRVLWVSPMYCVIRKKSRQWWPRPSRPWRTPVGQYSPLLATYLDCQKVGAFSRRPPACSLSLARTHHRTVAGQNCDSFVELVRKLGNFRYILIPEIINKFMTNISDPVITKHVHVFKLNLK